MLAVDNDGGVTDFTGANVTNENSVIVATNVATQATTFLITDTKLYIRVVPLSTQDNAKLLGQLTSGLKRTINWNKCQTKVSTER